MGWANAVTGPLEWVGKFGTPDLDNQAKKEFRRIRRNKKWDVSKLNHFKVIGNSVYIQTWIQHTCFVLKIGDSKLVYYVLCSTHILKT